MDEPLKQNTVVLPSSEKSRYGRVFLLALLTAAVMFLPSVIYYGGYFFFSGDFNVQQVPFYTMAHRAVREGSLFWNWNTDLGANFISSYSFYLLGSPFFWLTIPFPTDWVPYLMAPLLVLKTACAALTGYAFIKRFVKNQDFAMVGGLLYAFSGFTTYNIFFNHFHEPVIFFPLMLIALEELVLNNRRGWFALAVALNAVVNYFFFVGQVTFVILYFFLRFADENWRMTLSRFLGVALEAVLGVLLAGFMLLPSVLTVMENPRTSTHLYGFNTILYDRIQRYPSIIQSMFFPPELPARPNFFPDNGSKWTSMAAWMPFVSMTGVIAYCQSRKKDWIKRVLFACLIMAMVPVLNSMFFLFNSSYYARWFYMPVLIMALASAKGISEPDVDLARGFRWNLAITSAFVVGVGLMPKKGEEDALTIGLYSNPERFCGYVIIVFYCILMFWLIWRFYREKSGYSRLVKASVCITAVIATVFFLLSGSIGQQESGFISRTRTASAESMGLDADYFWRMDIDGDTMDNQGMFWDIPNIQAFHSVVPASIMEFYPAVGVTRDVASRPEQKYYALRGLLSVKYLFIAESDQDVECTLPGFHYMKTENEFRIYQNDWFVPMGFCYDQYITETQLEEVAKDLRSRLMMKAVVLSDEQAEKYSGLLGQVENPNSLDLSQESYQEDCAARRSQSAGSFTHDNSGFTAHITLEKENLVFFSVPYESGWTVAVNGEPAEVEKVNIGLMAVKAEAGENEIRFQYETPGLRIGLYAGAGALAVLIVYVVICLAIKRRSSVAAAVPQQSEAALPDSDPEETGPVCWDSPEDMLVPPEPEPLPPDTAEGPHPLEGQPEQKEEEQP